MSTQWRPPTTYPPLDSYIDDERCSALHAVRVDPARSPEPDALEVVVAGRWWPADDEEGHAACWRNRLGQVLQVIGWRPLTEKEGVRLARSGR